MRSSWRIPTFYLCLSIAYFLPSILLGKVPVPLENVYLFPEPYWKPYAPPELTSPQNGTLIDVTHFYYPYMRFAVQQLKAGDIPLWNPYIYSGMPFLASQQPAVLYPLNLLFAPLGPFWIWTATGIVRLFLVGWGLHLLMRRFGVSTPAALWSGTTYMLAGSGIAWLHYGIHNVLALLPLALYTTDRLIERARGRWFLLLTACLAFQFLGGHPETSVLFALIWGGFTLVRMPWRERPLRPLALIGLASLAAVGLTLPQLLPTIELIPESVTFFKRETGQAPPIGAGEWGNLRAWLLTLNPYLFGTPVGDRYLTPVTNYNETVTYLGIFTIPLMILGMVASRSRRLALYWAALALVSLSLIYAIPGFIAIRQLPVLNLGHGIRYIFSWSIAAAILAGFGVEAILRSPERWKYIVPALATLSVLLLGWSVYDLATAADGSWIFGGRPQPVHLHRIAAFYNRGSLQLLSLLAAAGLGWVVLAAMLRTRRIKIVVSLLLGITSVELLVHGVPYNSFSDPRLIYPRTALTNQLHEAGGEFRIATLDGVLSDNTSMTQDLTNVAGLDDLVSFRYLVFAGRASKIGLDQGTYVIQPLAQRFFDLANVRYLLTTKPLSGTTSMGTWRLARQDGEVHAYENPARLPRAYVVPAVREVAPDAAVEAVYELDWDPRSEAIVEEAIEGLDRAVETPLEATAAIARYEPEQVAVDVAVSRPAFLVLSESYATGWTAEIDGRPARLYRANGVYRGVVVPAGAHRVVFTYRPATWEIGRIVALGTIVACLGGAYAARRRRETHDENAPTPRA